MSTTFASDVKPLNNQPLTHGRITWFAIPTSRIQRAVSFYERVLGEKLQDISGKDPMFMLPCEDGEVGGALIQRMDADPGPEGPIVYLRVKDALGDVRSRVEASGGALLTETTALPNVPGIFCIMRDSEGNHVGLHAQN